MCRTDSIPPEGEHHFRLSLFRISITHSKNKNLFHKRVHLLSTLDFVRDDCIHRFRRIKRLTQDIHSGELVEHAMWGLVCRSDHFRPTPGIDATILRTCRGVHDEALPILYQENQFLFSQVKSLRAFRTHNLARLRSKFIKPLSQTILGASKGTST